MKYADLYAKIDKAECILEDILLKDPRTFENPECEDSVLFDSVETALKALKNADKFLTSKEYWDD